MVINPFIYGEEVRGDTFCNRKKEIKGLVTDIQNGQNVILYSPRRYGKTSLIKEVLRYVENKGVSGIYLDLYPVLKEEDFISIYARAVSNTIKGPVEKVIETLRTIFKLLRPQITITPHGDTEFGVEFIQDVTLMIEDVAHSVKRYADSTGRQVAVVFDEFQQIGYLGNDRLERELRTIIQTHTRNIAYIFMGSRRHLINEIFSNPNRPLYKIGKHYPLSRIKRDELVEFVIKRFLDTGKTITMDIVSRVVDITDCHPYYLQHLCHTIWDMTEDRVDDGIIDRALQDTIFRERPAYIALWDSLTLNQRKVIIMIAGLREDEGIYSKDAMMRSGLTPAIIQRNIKGVVERDIINKVNGRYEFNDVFLNLWIQREMMR
ncbi:MAG: ATP-binding protein [Nitrospirota bacterium]